MGAVVAVQLADRFAVVVHFAASIVCFRRQFFAVVGVDWGTTLYTNIDQHSGRSHFSFFDRQM